MIPVTLSPEWNLITRTIVPLNTQLQMFHNVVQPDIGPDWQLRLQAAILLPK